jgi:hypothetical protein
MASNINPNNIDTTYPIAGQDNDSQGFRDNFTNIKTNFQFAETEIDDLQAKVLLKSALTGTALDNDMAGALIENAKIQGFRGTRVALGSVSGTATIDYAAGHYYTLTTSASVGLNFSNFPSAGNQAWIAVRITVSSTAHTLTLPAAVGAGASATNVLGIQGWNTNVITFAETGTYEFEFRTDDGGSSIYINELSRPRNRLINPLLLASSEDLADAGAASLSTTTSYFETAAAETATLAAGVNGQIKVFAMAADSGNMVITVTNAGWKTSGTGTITFDDIGDACTLQYINNKWYCVGNNGCTFA